MNTDDSPRETRQVSVDQIDPNPRNPRGKFNEEKISELAESISSKGLLQPVLVRPAADRFELVHGERRLRAVQSLEWDNITAEVRELNDSEALEIAVTENLQREDISPIAEARGYQALIDEFGLTQAEAAERLGVSQSKISNQLRLLDLPETVRDFILRKIISPWQAQVIGSVWDRWNLLDLTVDHQLSVSELRDIKSQLKDGNEFVHFTRRWDISRIEPLLGERDLSTVLDDEDRREAYKSREFTHALLWLRENIPAYEDFETQAMQESGEVGSVTVSLATGEIVFGEARVRMAIDEDYTGDLAVKLNMPESVLRRVEYQEEAQNHAGTPGSAEEVAR